ncbi:hypothetical protein K0T92_12140 [Paenibacillus oenotherae]|uniref:Tubby C-terminal domain-containing protein n=1 Tax=Paenibacillus oenotherae TaxID=1435645 RepID=A0ABS7D6L1_9BACL|nr:hypothetical protein [Paenibacillus oenotherae]MBW7475501.1 hypothetical protein [Paenibacillus oenotherae]
MTNVQGKVVAYIERTYSNPLMRLLDIMTDGAMFADYRITDANHKLVVEANQVRTFIKRRQYYITYHSSEGTSKIHLVDKKIMDLGEKTDFEYQGKTYLLNKPLMDWGKIIMDGKPLAEWKETLSIPAKANFKLLDPAFTEHELLLLGIFHAYLHAPK